MHPLLHNRALIQGDQVPKGIVIQLRQPGFIGADDGASQLFLVLNHLVDAFFQGADGDKLVNKDVLLLANTKGPIRGLVFHGGVPPAVEVEHMVGFGQGNADAPGFQGQHKKPKVPSPGPGTG